MLLLDDDQGRRRRLVLFNGAVFRDPIAVAKSPSDHRPGSASRMVLRINRSCLVAQCLGITERVTAAAMPI